ncbi:GroES-like protein [Neolentinus lepideus HHB14362 ss-1]|uniref:alcohol dehydrogenase (NADP(+)) n=1 Tax=Neolentinus lepideus HHB14362 ss-1 TaxID=1314782 RepID=A0A165RLZ4_9AGAM|nr:GroES-like protein [Neolentinus lepideus HHB14362 ss-1]
MSGQVEFKGYAMTDASNWSDFKVVSFEPKKFEETDVEIAITHCGVCASDVHSLCQDWGQARLPLIAGHEIVGKVTRVGSKVTGIKVGDRAGVGAQVSSCLQCRECSEDYETYCQNLIWTYNHQYSDGIQTQGGYSTAIRANERFVFPVPDGVSSADAASMFCGGLTVYSPLVSNGCGPGKRVGVVGIGGLGHYAILFAKALGAEVYAFTHSASKDEDIKKMGADHIIHTSDPDFAKPYARKLDIIISTRNEASSMPLSQFLSTLYVHGKFVAVGLPAAGDPFPAIQPTSFIRNGSFFGSSHLGSKKECVEMLKLAAEKNIKPWIEELPMKDVKKAVEGVKNGNAKYRYVLVQDLVPVA